MNMTTEPTQLPAEAREAIAEVVGSYHQPTIDALCAALAPLWPKPLGLRAIQEATARAEKAEAALADAQRDKERLLALAKIVWDARWGKGENQQHTEELNRMVGIAAEIISGNMKSIDQAMKETRK